MKRVVKQFNIPQNPSVFKQKLLFWVSHQEVFSFLDTSGFTKDRFDWVLALDPYDFLRVEDEQAFLALSDFQNRLQDWLFGFFSYDLKNEIDLSLYSNNHDGLAFPNLYFFQPKKLIKFEDSVLTFEYLPVCAKEMDKDLQAINTTVVSDLQHSFTSAMKPRMSKEAYLEKFKTLQKLLHAGDSYQVNLCQEFYAKDVSIDPLLVYLKLNQLSPAPFSSFLRLDERYVLSSSPERFLKKQGDKLLSEPIKGTMRRSDDLEEDKQLLHQLKMSKKDLAENTMIVDLVRNDLSRIALDGSVKVDQLCQIRSLSQVYQMVSEVSCSIPRNLPLHRLFYALFPMGSMTGAPKRRSMEVIEDLEESKRGLYSGSIGYITPQGDFDFNVVIRTILYNQDQRYVSASVGSGITVQSDGEMEYEECLLKVRVLQDVLM